MWFCRVALSGQGRFIRSYFYELFIAQAEGKLKEKLEEIETGLGQMRFG